MRNPRKPSKLEDLDARLAAARAEQRASLGSERQPESDRAAHGWAWRVAIEMVVAVVVCSGVGWYLDKWLGTLPLFLILFFFLGAGAGLNNVVRAARNMNRTAAGGGATTGTAGAEPGKKTDGTSGSHRS